MSWHVLQLKHEYLCVILACRMLIKKFSTKGVVSFFGTLSFYSIHHRKQDGKK